MTLRTPHAIKRACGAMADYLGLVGQVRRRSVLTQQPVQVVQPLGMVVSAVPLEHQLYRHRGDQPPVELQQRVAAESDRPRAGCSPHGVKNLKPAVEHQRVGRSSAALDTPEEVWKFPFGFGHALQGATLHLSQSMTSFRRTESPYTSSFRRSRWH
jgi:hypothetical protein